MQVSRAEAAAALADVSRMQNRAAELGGYRMASPHLLLWAVVWLLGYAACGVLPPDRWGLAWLPLNVVGIAGSLWVGSRSAAGRVSGNLWRAPVMALVLALLMLGTFVLFRAESTAPYLAYPGVVMGAVYALLGLYRAPRLILLGAALFGLTLAGYFLAQPWLAFWMAATGGGGLFLAGLWLRRV